MLSGLLVGLGLGMIGNIITGLCNRNAGLKFLKWLVFYCTVLIIYIALTAEVPWREAMQIAKRYPQIISYFLVIAISAFLGGIYWKGINIAVQKIDKLTTPGEGGVTLPPDKVLEQKKKLSNPSTARDIADVTRPHFIIKAPGIKDVLKPLPNEPHYRRIQITMENDGGAPAVDLTGKVIMIDQKFVTKPFIDRFSLAGEVPLHTPTPYYNDSAIIPQEAVPMWVVLAIKYRGTTKAGVEYAQAFYMKWGGVQSGVTAPDFVYVSVTERDIIYDGLKDELEEYANGN
jgi:hypothetical protein